MVPHCGFDLHFSDNEWCWASFHVFVSICMSSLEKCLFSSPLAFNSNSQDKVGYTAIKTNKQKNSQWSFTPKTLSVKQNKPQVQVTFQANYPPSGAWFMRQIHSNMKVYSWSERGKEEQETLEGLKAIYFSYTHILLARTSHMTCLVSKGLRI